MSAIHEKNADYKGRFIIGKVVDNDDPDQLQRVRVRLPHIYDDISDDSELPWALPATQRFQGATSSVGTFGVPVVDTDIIVILDDGNRYSPIYLGSVLTSEDLKLISGTSYLDTYGIQDKAGNKIYVDAGSSNTIAIKHASGTEIVIDNSGKLSITTVADTEITSAADVTITADAECNITATSKATVTVGATLIEATPATAKITNGPAKVELTGPLVLLN